jgi:sugar lactone lactonase YvrE
MYDSHQPRAPALIEPPRCLLALASELGEGPHWSVAEQSLYWVDISGRRLHRWALAANHHRDWEFPEEVAAVCGRRHAAGLLLSLRHGFALFDPQQSAAKMTRLVHPEAGLPGNRFNDAKCDARGRYWAGSMDMDARLPTGVLHRLDANDQCTRHEKNIAVINGPTWSLNGRTMFLCDTAAGTIYAYDFDPDQGTLGARRQWLRLTAGEGLPDGLCTDAAGRIWLAHWQGGCVTCHDPHSAAELLRVALPVSQVTSCAFGGPDLQTLYITSARIGLDARQLADEPLAGGLFSARISEPGLPPCLYAG